jgi:hypothetical protein
MFALLRVEGTDEEVQVCFDPLQICTRVETTAARRFAEEADLLGSETATPNFVGGQTEAEAAVGTVLGRCLGRFGSEFGEPAGSTDPLAYGDPFSRHQNQRDGDFMRQKTEKTPTTGVFGLLGSNTGISEVDYRRFGSGKAAKTLPYGDAEAGVRGGDEDHYESAAQTGTVIFKKCLC